MKFLNFLWLFSKETAAVSSGCILGLNQWKVSSSPFLAKSSPTLGNHILPPSMVNTTVKWTRKSPFMHGHQTCACSVFLVAAGLCLLLHCGPAGCFPLWSDCGQCEGRQWCLLWFLYHWSFWTVSSYARSSGSACWVNWDESKMLKQWKGGKLRLGFRE